MERTTLTTSPCDDVAASEGARERVAAVTPPPRASVLLPTALPPPAWRRRLADETGAQVAEYAMLGGVSAAACATLVAILKHPGFWRALMRALQEACTRAIGSWI